MYFDSAYRYLGSIDPEPLARVIDSWGEAAWNEYVRRQERFRPHRYTQTIPLLYDEDMRHTNPTAWPRFGELETLVHPVLEMIQGSMQRAGPAGDGYFNRIILTRLSPGSAINPHRDYGESLLRSHRCHLVITTNERVHFIIDGEVKHLAAGELWEINNRGLHGVQNLGQEPRTHLILDYVVPGEEINDPEEGLIVS